MSLNSRRPSNIEKITAKFSSDHHFREVVLKGSLGFAVKILSALSIFLMNIIIARKLGATESGIFFLSFTLVGLISAIGRMGLENSLVRFIAHFEAIGELHKVHLVFRKSITWSLILSFLLLVAFLLIIPYLTSFALPHPGLSPVLYIMSIAIPLVSIYTLFSYALQGIKSIAQSLIILSVITPATVLVGLLLTSPETSIEVAKIYLVGCLLSLLLGYYWWKNLSPTFFYTSAQVDNFSNSQLWSSSFPLWGVVILNQIIQWSSQLLLGAWGSAKDIALFSTAQRTALLTSFILIAINSIVAPKFAALYARNNITDIRRIAIWSVRILLIASTPIVCIFLIFPSQIMGIFGDDFRDAALALSILSIGQFVNIATGSVGFLLSMTGHESKLRFNLFIGAFLGISLGVILIPNYGILGAAIATSFSIAIQNLLGVYHVKKIFGFNTLFFWKTL